MIVGERLRELREKKNFSQGEVEKRSGLLRCYISRVENGHTVPAVETLEKLARALEVPMYHLFYDGENPPAMLNMSKKNGNGAEWGSSGRGAHLVQKFRELFSRMERDDVKIMLAVAQRMAKRNPGRPTYINAGRASSGKASASRSLRSSVSRLKGLGSKMAWGSGS